MEIHKIVICLVIYFLIATVRCNPEEKKDPDNESVEEDNKLSNKCNRCTSTTKLTTTEPEDEAQTTLGDPTTVDATEQGEGDATEQGEGDATEQGEGDATEQGEGDINTTEPTTSAVDKNCWLQINVKKHFETMDRLDEKNHQARQNFQEAITEKNLNNEMLDMMLQTRAAAERAIYNFDGIPSKIPAGINLGGYGMMKLNDAMLFFHRMKLRNDTRFRVNFINNDVYNMLMTARLSLNDLHLFGQYERAITDKENLFYRPTFGELEILLKSVTYKIEGRLRLVQNRLVVEHVLSELHMKDVLLMYYVNGSTTCQASEQLPPSALSEFLERLKADLDSWLKDYFNDYLLLFELTDSVANKEIHSYDKQKQLRLNDFMDHTIKQMHKKLYSLKPSCASVKTPAFSIFSINGIQIRLHSGVIRGMDSFYRQSVATGRSEDKKLRLVDAVIGFSKLKMEYKYQAKISGKTPPLMGLFVLSADELIAHLGITTVKDPEAVELSIGYLRQIRPQTLVIEGAINRMVGNFKHVLENEIISLMTNALNIQIKQLATLSRCEPTLVCHEDDGDIAYNPDGDHHGAHGPDFGMKRNDSIELEVPGGEKRPPKKMHIRYYEDLAVSESEMMEEPKQESPKVEGEIVTNENTDDEKQNEKGTKEGRRKGRKQKKARRSRKAGKRGITF